MEELFNSREISIGIWVSVLLIWALTKKELRKSLFRVVAAALNKRLALPVSVFAGYLSLVVGLLTAIGFWHLEMLKATIYWFVLSGLALFGKAITSSKPIEDWQGTLREQASIIVILAFIVNSYTFSLYAEIVLVPVVAFVSMLVAYAEFHHKGEPVANVFLGVQAFIGFVILLLAGMNAYNDYANLASIATAKELFLPVVMATMAIPYMYFIALYSAYDRILRISTFKQSSEMASYIRRRILLSGGLRLRKARRIAAIKPYEFMRANNQEDVDLVIERHLAGDAGTSETGWD